MILTLLLMFGGQQVLALSGSGTKSDPYLISTSSEWQDFAKTVTKAATVGKYYALSADLDFSTVPEFCPIGGWIMKRNHLASQCGQAQYSFAGYFDGRGHTIKNINFTPANSNADNGFYGVFGYVNGESGASIENLIIRNMTVKFGTSGHTGCLAGYCVNQVTINNCLVINANLNVGGSQNVYTGGLVGSMSANDATITNCAVDSVTLTNSSGSKIGGLIGRADDSFTMSNCYANVTITDATDLVGGLFGSLYSTALSTKYDISTSYARGSISLKKQNDISNVGGFVGQCAYATFTDCGSSVDITTENVTTTVEDKQIGAFVGNIDYNSNFNNCFAAGPITFRVLSTNSSMGVNYFDGEFSALNASTNSYTYCYASDGIFNENPVMSANFPTKSAGGDYYGYPNPSDYADALKASDFVASQDMAALLNDNTDAMTWTYCKTLNGGYPFPSRSAYLHLLRVEDPTKVTASDSAKMTQKFICPVGEHADPVIDTTEQNACSSFVYGGVTYKEDTVLTLHHTAQDGTDSISCIKVHIVQPVSKDTAAVVCLTASAPSFNFVSQKDGQTYSYTTDTEIKVVKITDEITVSGAVCPTYVNYTFTLHPQPRTVNDEVKLVCDKDTFYKYNGKAVYVNYPASEVPYVIKDTLKANSCACDSIYHFVTIDKVSRSYTLANVDAKNLQSVSLYGCSSSDLVYTRDLTKSVWNTAKTKTFKYGNQSKFTEYDTMKTYAGCDSVVLINVEFDQPHKLEDVKKFDICAADAPFSIAGQTVSANADGSNNVVTIPALTYKSTTGGCDTTQSAVVTVYGLKHNSVEYKSSSCVKGEWKAPSAKVYAYLQDTVLVDTLRRATAPACDSVITECHASLSTDSQVTKDSVFVCNSYKGKTYSKTTVVIDTVVNVLDGGCKQVELTPVKIKVGTYSVAYACGGIYKGQTYTHDDIVYDDETCSQVGIKVYPKVSTAEGKTFEVGLKSDETVNFKIGNDDYIAISTPTKFTLTTPDAKTFVVYRTNHAFKDSLVYEATIKSKICDCDSIVYPVKVSFLSYVTSDSIEAKCGPYKYTRMDGDVVYIDSFTTAQWTAQEPEPGWKYIKYSDTLYTSADKNAAHIKMLVIHLYRTAKIEDSTYVLNKCDKVTFSDCNGDRHTFEGEKYLDLQTYNCVEMDEDAGCPAAYTTYYIQLKGLSTVGNTYTIGSTGEPENMEVASETNPNGLACDIVYLMNNPFVKSTTQKVKTAVSSENPCGTSDQYIITVNHSVDTTIYVHGCGLVKYTDKSGVEHEFTTSQTYKDVQKHVVPTCKCDSIFNINVTVHNVEVKKDTVSNCDSYVYHFMSGSKKDLTVERDTVISDTLHSACSVCLSNGVVCDSIIRMTTIRILKSNQTKVDTTVFSGCGSVDYDSQTYTKDTVLTLHHNDVNGCDSISCVNIHILEAGTIDSVINICLTKEQPSVDFVTKNPTRTYELSASTEVVVYNISDIIRVEGQECATQVNYQIFVHPAARNEVQTIPLVCDDDTIYKYDGTPVSISYSSTTTPFEMRDTLKAQGCGCDSIYRVTKVNKISRSFTPDNVAEADRDTTVKLFGCDSNHLFYYRDTTNSPWNNALTKEFTVAVSKNYRFTAYDTMKTVVGCDSVIVIEGEFDHPHNLSTTRYYNLCAAETPFHIADTVLYANQNGLNYKISFPEVTFQSTIGGCDTVQPAIITVYGIKKDTIRKKFCDEAKWMAPSKKVYTVNHDTVVYDTMSHVLPPYCDSLVSVAIIKVGHSTPQSDISKVILSDCDVVSFVDSSTSYNRPYSFNWSYDPLINYPITQRIPYLNLSGCDSTVTIEATVKSTSHRIVGTSEHPKAVCGAYRIFDQYHISHVFRLPDDFVGDSLIYYSDTIAGGSSNGCDSIVEYNIKLSPLRRADTTIYGCGTLSAVAPADSLDGTLSGMPKMLYKNISSDFKHDTVLVKKFFLPNVITCDTSYTVKVILTPSHSITLDSCGQVSFRGQVFKADTTIIYKDRSSYGCDSIDTFHIKVHPVVRDSFKYDGCGYVSVDGVYKTRSAVYSDTLRYKSCNCDSVITTYDVKVRKNPSVTIDVDSCMHLAYKTVKFDHFDYNVFENIYTFTDKDTVYKSSEKYYILGQKGENGCDSILEYNLNVNSCFPYPVIINKYNWVLTCNKDFIGDGVTKYRWYKHVGYDEDGNDKDQLLANANESYYTEDQRLSGCYRVVVTYNDSVNVSSEELCIDEDSVISLSYNLYPDPVAKNEPVYLECNFDCSGSVVEVYNALAVKVYSAIAEGKKITLPAACHPSSGYYFVKLITPDKVVLAVKFLVKSN